MLFTLQVEGYVPDGIQVTWRCFFSPKSKDLPSWPRMVYLWFPTRSHLWLLTDIRRTGEIDWLPFIGKKVSHRKKETHEWEHLLFLITPNKEVNLVYNIAFQITVWTIHKSYYISVLEKELGTKEIELQLKRNIESELNSIINRTNNSKYKRQINEFVKKSKNLEWDQSKNMIRITNF